MSKEYYKRFRPATLKGIVGQEAAVATLQKFIDKDTIPHSILFTGPSGCGKTTLARVLRAPLDVGEMDFFEKNCADFRSIDDIREIRRNCGFNPISGSARMWIIDEVHKLTNDAQNAFLKLLEDTPDHVYFVLCTTDPRKLIKTIHTRCTEIKLAGLPPKAVERILQRVIDKEQLVVDPEVIQEIVEVSEGSARKALVILEQVGSLEGVDAQLAAIQVSSINKDSAFNLAQELMFPKGGWPAIAKLLRSLAEEDPETCRYIVLGYCRSCMVGKEDKGPNPKLGPRAYKIIDIFSKNFYDSKHAGLAAACWEVLYAND
jgi:DNA polymerase-3 subunit gamma/tau